MAGGLGISSTWHRNRVILMNQAWHLYTNPNTLYAQVLKAKYFPHAILFTSPWHSKGSHIWTAFSLGAKLLLLGISWIIGDGQTIRIWKDPWLPQGSCHAPNPIPGFVTMIGMLISSLNLILTRTNLTFTKLFQKLLSFFSYLFLYFFI